MTRIVQIGKSLKPWQPKKKKKKYKEKVTKTTLEKQSRKSIRKELDELWAELVKKRAGYKCERSGKTRYLNSHHIFSRSNLSVRWDLDNGVCLNAGWHTLQTNSAHKAPIEFIEWIKDKRGEKWYQELRIKANQIKKWSTPELRILLERFRKELLSDYILEVK